MCPRGLLGLSSCTLGDGTRFLSLSGYLSPELRSQLREARGPGRAGLAQAALPAASGASRPRGRVSGPRPRSSAPSRAQRRTRACSRCGGPSSLCPRRVWGRLCPRGRRSMAGAAQGLHWRMRGAGSPHRAAGRAWREDRAAPSRGPTLPRPRHRRPAGGLTAARRAPGEPAWTGSGTMTRAPLAAAPSQPAGKPISHSSRQSPAARRFVPRGPGPLSLALITLSRLTAPPAAPRTPVPRCQLHNGSGNRPRWGPG